MNKLRAPHRHRHSQSAATSLRIDFNFRHGILSFVKRKVGKHHAKMAADRKRELRRLAKVEKAAQMKPPEQAHE